MQCERSANAQFHGAAIQHRKRPGQAEAYRTRVGVRRIAEARRARAEGLGRGLQLHVDFEPDDRLVTRQDLGRDTRRILCQLRHES